jgi:hypothetical protein
VGGTQTHSHCDEDWIRFTAVAGRTYVIETSSLLNNADTVIYLHESCGAQLYTDDDGGSEFHASRLQYTPSVSGSVDIRITEYNSSYLAGEGYNITVTCTANCTTDLIFSNGFETGSTSAWSLSIP